METTGITKREEKKEKKKKKGREEKKERGRGKKESEGQRVQERLLPFVSLQSVCCVLRQMFCAWASV